MLDATKLLEEQSEINLDIQDLVKLKQDAKSIDDNVSKILVQANKTMKVFESLKYQKRNVELLMNTLNSFLELNRLKESIPLALKDKNIEKSIKLAQVFTEIQPIIIKEFCKDDFLFVEQLVKKDLVNLQKEMFELAVKQNNLDQINLCSQLAKTLQVDCSFDKIKEIHSQEIRQQLKNLEEQFFDKLPIQYDLLQSQYKFTIGEHFIQILETIKAEEYAKSMGEEAFLQLIKHLLENICSPFLIGTIKKLQGFFEIDKMLKSTSKPQFDNSLYQSISKTYYLNEKQLQRLEDYNLEISDIAQQYYGFIDHCQKFSKQEIKIKFGDIITEQLGYYLEYSKIKMNQRVLQIIQNSQAINSLWNFDKIKFHHLVAIKDPLMGNGFHQWLEEIFYLIKEQILEFYYTNDPIITSAFINFVGYNLIGEDLFQISLQLYHRYLKKEYFTSNSICISEEPTVHNSFIILLFNILSNIPNYLKTLKSQIFSEIQQPKQMITAAIDEMIESNQKRFQKLTDEKIKQLADYLKNTISNTYDEIKSLSFTSNELVMKEQEREYTKLFSGQFKQTYKFNIWQKQFNYDNYELLIYHSSSIAAKNLEVIIMQKQYHFIGAILVEKEIRNIVNYFQSLCTTNVKQQFNRLQLVCETLIQEKYADMDEFHSSVAIQEISLQDMKKIKLLRVDLQ
ncbi:hypothetical protein pb186bvf_010523 [Paramecium bursaria]